MVDVLPIENELDNLFLGSTSHGILGGQRPPPLNFRSQLSFRFPLVETSPGPPLKPSLPAQSLQIFIAHINNRENINLIVWWHSSLEKLKQLYFYFTMAEENFEI